MSRPRVMSIFGTRPEAIKMAPVVLAVAAQPQLEHVLVVTAQHRGLLDEVLELFALTPERDLGIMRHRQGLEHVTTAALSGLGDALAELKPDFVLVHGDTTTTFAAALAAFYRDVPVGHVEAGLRTSTIRRPFPEEFNRRAADLLATHYYCPTAAAADNINRNPELQGKVFITGNTALDAVRLAYRPDYAFRAPELKDFTAYQGPKLLLTAHRRENWGAPLAEICHGLKAALADEPEARACFCWHPNPAVREVVGPILAGHPQVLLVEPPRFDEFINLAARMDLILSDSGGIQEEATQLRRFVLVLREETERPEAVAAGFARLCPPERDALREQVAELLPRMLAGELVPRTLSPFGDGYAAERITEALSGHLEISASHIRNAE